MGSFVELLSSGNVDCSDPFWQDSQFASPPEEQEIEEVQDVQLTAPLKRKGRQSRSRNFSENEDKLVCESWLEVSLDGAQSTDQHRSTYWERIHEYFHKHKNFQSDRSVKALSNRWSTILEFTNRFCGCYTQIENRNESGRNEQDKVLDACAMYKGVADPLHRSFTLLHCWHVLRHEQKWIDLCAKKKQKGPVHTTGTNESRPDEEQGGCHTSPKKDARPIGKKKAKEQRRGLHSDSSVEKVYMDAMDTMWSKKKEAEDMKEKKRKERDDIFFALEQQRIDDKKAMVQQRLEEKMALERKKHEDKMALEKKKLDDKKEAEMRRLELHERELDDKVMNMDLSGMNEVQQQYYMRMQQEILARRFT